MNEAEKSAELSQLYKIYNEFKSRNLSLDMSRGKPEIRQLNMSVPMLKKEMDDYDFICENGIDVRNYNTNTGIPEARRLFGELLNLPAEQVIVGGNSSLNLIHDALSRAMLCGPLEGDVPWSHLKRVKFIFPVPGYDWHFNMCSDLGIEIIPVPITGTDPDMDMVEEIALDPDVKGFICSPMYSNPSGVTFSDSAVERLASMKSGAHDFRIFWDNAYCVHHLYPDKRDRLKDIYAECAKSGNEDRVLMFTSTSKITFPGGGMSAMAASPANIERQSRLLRYQIVNYNTINQLRHVRFLPDREAVETHMAKHAEILRPKFDYVLDVFERELSGIASWSRPRGGYFICFYAPHGCAKRIVELCSQAGVTLTPAGSPYPFGVDPFDSTLRIAPSYPPLSELKQVMELFPAVVKIAAIECGAEIN